MYEQVVRHTNNEPVEAFGLTAMGLGVSILPRSARNANDPEGLVYRKFSGAAPTLDGLQMPAWLALWLPPEAVLLLSGEFDPVTPPRYGEQLLASLGKARHLVGKGQGHILLSRGCMPRLAGSVKARYLPR